MKILWAAYFETRVITRDFHCSIRPPKIFQKNKNKLVKKRNLIDEFCVDSKKINQSSFAWEVVWLSWKLGNRYFSWERYEMLINCNRPPAPPSLSLSPETAGGFAIQLLLPILLITLFPSTLNKVHFTPFATHPLSEIPTRKNYTMFVSDLIRKVIIGRIRYLIR